MAQSGYGTRSIYDRSVPDLPKDTAVYTLPPNTFYYDQLWKDSIYRYPGFQESRLVFENGFSPNTKLNVNYNIFLETMDVKDETGSVSVMKKLPEVRKLILGNHVFLFKPEFGYLELVVEGNVSVGVRTYMECIVELSNGYKYPQTGFDQRTSRARYTRHYWISERHYILTADGKVHRAGTNTLPRMMPEHKREIRSYAKDNKIDYRKKTDVIRMVNYCNGL